MMEANESDNAEKKRRWLPLGAFWMVAWLGTVAGGAAFGVFAGPPGIIIGLLVAAAVSGPLHLAAGLLTAVGPLVGLRYPVAVLVGAVSGVFSAQGAGMSQTAMMLAAGVGGVATFCTLHWCLRKTWLKNHRDILFRRHFTLGETMVFFTILVAVLGAGQTMYRFIVQIQNV